MEKDIAGEGRDDGRSSARLSPLYDWRGYLTDKDYGVKPREDAEVKVRASTLRLVGLALSLHMSTKGDSCFPALETLAAESGLSKSSLVAAIHELVATGWLTRKIGGGRGHPTRYTAVVPETVRRSVSLREEKRTAESVNGSPTGQEVLDPRPRPSVEANASTASEPSQELVPIESGTALASAQPSSQALVGRFVDEARVRGSDPPKRVVGAMARNVKQLLDEGRSEDEIEAGFVLMLDRGLANASLLAQFVAEAQLTPRARAPSRRYGYGVRQDEWETLQQGLEEVGR